MLLTLLLQTAEMAKAGIALTQQVGQQAKEQSPTQLFFFWTTVVLAVGFATSLWMHYKVLTGMPDKVQAACKDQMAGYEKAEKELKAGYAKEIAINEANHQRGMEILQGVVTDLQDKLADAHGERRDAQDQVNTIAERVATILDKFSEKFNTFAELQASQIAGLQTTKSDILLEITRLFSRLK